MVCLHLQAADVHRKHALQQGLKAIADSQPAAGAARTAAAAAQTSQAPSARAVSDADLERVLVCADDHACLGVRAFRRHRRQCVNAALGVGNDVECYAGNRPVPYITSCKECSWLKN